ncbi:MAG: DNA polymerase I [Lentisphaeria bacterium]|nr:DNA polymerase I [Lentisphaeria bacterium]
MAENVSVLTVKDDQLLCTDFPGKAVAGADFSRLAGRTIAVFDYKALLNEFEDISQLPVENIFDCKLACNLYDPALDCSCASSCAAALFKEEAPALENATTAELIWKLYEFLKNAMQGNKLFYDVEMPLSQVLSKMEKRGIALDGKGLAGFGEKLSGELAALESAVYQAAGKEFNINSTKQLNTLLFEELKLEPAGKKTKSGYSTDAEALEKMLDQHPVIELILKYRKIAKIHSTYVEGLLKYLQSDGKVHTSFNMTATATGRLSSTEPNLQNIPTAAEAGGEIRKFFHAGEDSVLIDADYSQIELRILAHIANDPVMINAFKNNEDIHAVTASQIFNVNISEVTSAMRRQAKAVNFGIVYGISAFALANDLGISKKEAENYIASYFEKYSAVKNYLDNAVKTAKVSGYAETMWGRRRYLPELKSKIFAVRSFGERVALNMPIQGSAADLIKVAMIKVDSELKKAGLTAGLLLQIHDELLLSAPANEAEKAAGILKNAMESAAKLAVPLAVSLKIGKDYYSVK